MEKIEIPQKKWLSLLCALLYLYIGGVLVAEPVLAFLLPIENATASEILSFRIVSVIAAILVGLPLLGICFSLLFRLKYKYAIVADEEGLHCNCIGSFASGFVPWEAIAEMKYRKRKFLCTETSNTLVISLNENSRTKLSPLQNVNARLTHLSGTGQTRLNVHFTVCKGKGRELAEQLCKYWEKRRFQKAPSE